MVSWIKKISSGKKISKIKWGIDKMTNTKYAKKSHSNDLINTSLIKLINTPCICCYKNITRRSEYDEMQTIPSYTAQPNSSAWHDRMGNKTVMWSTNLLAVWLTDELAGYLPSLLSNWLAIVTSLRRIGEPNAYLRNSYFKFLYATNFLLD